MIPEIVTQISNYLFAISMPFTHIGGYFASIVGFVFAWKFWHKMRSNTILFWLKILIIYGLIRAILSSEPKTGYACMLGYFSQWLLPFILGYGLSFYNNRQSYKKVFWTYFIVFTSLSVFSFLAYFGLFFKSFGQGFYLVREDLLKGLRSHISFAALCLMFSFISFAQVLLNKEISDKKKNIFIALTIFYLICIFLTGSRGYYISAFLSYFILALIFFLGKKKFLRLIYVFISLLVMLPFFYFSIPNLKKRIDNTNLSDPNVQGRLSLYTVALNEIKDRPFFGFGPGQGIKQKKYFLMLPIDKRSVQTHTHLHSFYLNFLADFGIFGFIILTFLIYTLLRNIWFVSKTSNELYSVLAFGLFWGFIGILIGDMFDTLLRGPGVVMELFWLAGIVIGKSENEDNHI